MPHLSPHMKQAPVKNRTPTLKVSAQVRPGVAWKGGWVIHPTQYSPNCLRKQFGQPVASVTGAAAVRWGAAARLARTSGRCLSCLADRQRRPSGRPSIRQTAGCGEARRRQGGPAVAGRRGRRRRRRGWAADTATVCPTEWEAAGPVCVT